MEDTQKGNSLSWLVFRMVLREEKTIFLPNSSFKPCVPHLNLDKSLVPASLRPCKYFFKIPYTKPFVHVQLNLTIKSFPKLIIEKAKLNVPCVVQSVRVLLTCCGSLSLTYGEVHK